LYLPVLEKRGEESEILRGEKILDLVQSSLPQIAGTKKEIWYMKLKKLITGLDVEIKNAPKNLEITGLCSHSDLVVPGNLFIAKKRGADFIPKAVATGAAAVLTDIYNPFLAVPQIIHPRPEEIESELANRYYENPSERLSTIAVTGTNGKTTTSYMFRHIINTLGGACGLIGTIEYDTGAYTRQATLTTPDILTSQKLLSEMVRHGCTHCALEASSHGLSQGRLEGVSVDVGIFTNLSQDHLDYHETMESYADAKAILFSHIEKKGVALINGDDPASQRMKNGATGAAITFGMSEGVDVVIEIERQTLSGTRFSLTFQGEIVNGRIPLVGVYNVYNAVAASLAAAHFGYPLNDVVNTLRTFDGVPGRLERVPSKGRCNLFVDFAHTEEALRAVMNTLKETAKGKLIVVFGCGGNRDKTKRPKMGQIVDSIADFAIITSDNPRNEDPSTICEEVKRGFLSDNYEICVDREQAIARAVERADRDDVVLVAGRGHEPMQLFSGYSIPFRDSEVAAEILSRKSALV